MPLKLQVQKVVHEKGRQENNSVSIRSHLRIAGSAGFTFECSTSFGTHCSGGVLGTYHGSPLESVEAMAEAAGLNFRFYDIVESNRDETIWVRKCASRLLENARPLSRDPTARDSTYPPPG